MVGVEMRDHDGVDRLEVDAGGGHVCRQMRGVGLPLARQPASIMISLPFILSTTTVSGMGKKSVVSPAFAGAALCRRPGVGDEGRVVGLAPDAVIDGGDVDIADLVFVEADGRLDRRFGGEEV
jgi:hypothetical protein